MAQHNQGSPSSNQDKLAGLVQPELVEPSTQATGVPPWESKAPKPVSDYAPNTQETKKRPGVHSNPLTTSVKKDDDSQWTDQELTDAHSALLIEKDRLLEEIATTGAVFSQFDASGSALEREYETSLFSNARDMLDQVEYALARIGDGTYPVCELCGQAIGKYRLQMLPRATLCLVCKEAEERHSTADPSVNAAKILTTEPRFERIRIPGSPARSDPPPGEFLAPSHRPRNGKGTAALVCGILGLIPFPITGFWLSLIAIILGWQGRKRAERGEATNEGVAFSGFVLGIIGMGIQFLLALAIAFS